MGRDGANSGVTGFGDVPEPRSGFVDALVIASVTELNRLSR